MNIFKIISITSIILVIIIVIGEVCNTPNRIIENSTDYIYVMEYSLYDLDSAVYKYKATKTYDGVIINKEKNSHFVGVVGKGGHYVTDYNLIIKFNNTTIEQDDINLFEKYNKGDKVKVIESWYPYHNIKIQ